MASPTDDESIFDRLQQQREDPKVLEERQKAVNDRIHSIYEKAQTRLGELIDDNTTLPCTISSIQVLNATRTRRSFLHTVLSPLLSSNMDRPYTLAEVLQEVSKCTDKLHRFDIFEQPISVYLDKPSQTDPSTTPTDLDVYLSVKERSRFILKTGTDLGNGEGSAYANAQWRNIFGGAESFNVNFSKGTRTQSAYQGVFQTPLFGNPDFRFELGGVKSDSLKPWASYEETIRGAWARLHWLNDRGNRHEVGLNGFWRQTAANGMNVSPAVRADAGHSMKTSISHSWTNDQRDNPILPSRGHYVKTINELAGYGPLKSDVSFLKSEIETQAVLPIPGPKGDTGITFTSSFRAGLLYPLGFDSSMTRRPRINDRFQLGGPTDVRGFKLSGLGPHEGVDALGGDVYAAGSANLFFPLPRVGRDTPLRLQAFINSGRLLPLKMPNGDVPQTMAQANDSVVHTVSELANGLPSTAAGIGLVYAHPVARFELNFSLPLVLRKGEEGRKGLQFGVGISFL
ncbi:hypothetical protein LOZ66_006582 [Ophidiomyces ophidiicola]|nr:hypothetical protein LOZ66_006582 [Ophidiomyces ophidiicola]